jgi:pimeloyl-ACP methyl ester carboxylesterase
MRMLPIVLFAILSALATLALARFKQERALVVLLGRARTDARTDVVLYVHGLRLVGAAARRVSRRIDAVVEQNFRAALPSGVAYDAWSYSESVVFSAGGAPLDEAAAALAAYIAAAHAAKRVLVVGHSTGGLVGARAAVLCGALVRVVSVGAPHRGAALLAAAEFLGARALVARAYGPLARALYPSERRLDDLICRTLAGVTGGAAAAAAATQLGAARHLNIVLTNGGVAFDGKLFRGDQACAGARTVTLRGCEHTLSMLYDFRVLRLILEFL